jgi:hypothetical protein
VTVTTTASTTGPMEGDGSNASWPFSFPVQSASQLEVIHATAIAETVVSSSLYGVALVNEGRSGGTVTYPLDSSRVPAGEFVVVRRAMTFTQPTNLRNQGTLAPETVELVADRCVMQIQQVKERADRALRQPSSDADAIGELPAVASRASNYLAFDAEGDPIAASAVDLVGTTVSGYAATLLDDANAAAARATLGLGAAALLAVPVPVASGGTGATSAATARTALGAGQPATASLGNSGYWRSVDTGVIVQWGAVTGGSAATFPLAFPTSCAAVVGTAVFGGVRVVTATSISTTGFTCNCYDAAGANQTPTVRWIAIGY